MSTPAQDILVHNEQGVTTITFNRVTKKNSFTTSMYTDLANALDNAKADAATRVVAVTSGSGASTAFGLAEEVWGNW